MTKEEQNSEQHAFACVTETFIQEGLTKREYFAGLAMQGLLANATYAENFKGNNSNPVPDFIAEMSVSIADAILNKLDK